MTEINCQINLFTKNMIFFYDGILMQHLAKRSMKQYVNSDRIHIFIHCYTHTKKTLFLLSPLSLPRANRLF